MASTATVNKYMIDSTLSINVTRPAADGVHTSTIDYSFIDGTAYYGSDVTGAAKTGTINFGATDTYKLINYTIKATPTYTGNRSFTFAITNPTNGVALGLINTTAYTIIDTEENKPTFTIACDRYIAGSGEQIISTLIPSIDTGFDEISYYSEDLEIGADPYSNVYQNYNWKNINGDWCLWNGSAYDGAGLFDYADAKTYGPQYGHSEPIGYMQAYSTPANTSAGHRPTSPSESSAEIVA
jgi:hypothetical protein